MSGLDFSKVDDKPLVEKSYADQLDDKFAPKRGASKKVETPAKESNTIRRTTHKLKGWSQTADKEVEFIQEYENGKVVRKVSYLHPRIQVNEKFENGKIVETVHLLDGKFPLRAENERSVQKSDRPATNLYLYDGDMLVFKRHHYQNGTFREEFSTDYENPLTREELVYKGIRSIDERYFNTRGELSVRTGKKRSLKYKPLQINFYAPAELNEALIDISRLGGYSSKSQLINAILSGKVDPSIHEALKNRLEEDGISEMLEDN